MANFPESYDDDSTLPPVNDNITEVGEEAINAIRDLLFKLETYLGTGGAGSTSSISARIGISLDDSGAIKPSAIASLGLVTLPITNDQISNTAEIPESKLKLDHRTQDLFNYINDLSRGVNSATGWISSTGVKLDPHLLGAIYRHTFSHIDVSVNPEEYFKNRFNLLRDNTNALTVLTDLNDEFLTHQFADGSVHGTVQNIITADSSTYPSNYAHTSSGIFLNTSRFSIIPQTAQDLQQFAEFIDSSSTFLYGTRIQNLYSNGISRSSRSSSLLLDGYGSPVIPPTTAITYLLHAGTNSSPVDDINFGDDIIEFKPATAELNSNAFDEKFALIKIGDIARVNYGTVEVQFVIKEKKYIQNSGNKKFIIRINGKNLFYSTTASVRIDKPLFNNNKYGVLAVSAANNEFSETPSLIVSNPRSAQALGIGFNPDTIDDKHYLLYLVIYPTGNPAVSTALPPIDITGNLGATPGLYTLDSIVEATNNAFRKTGYNYRFVAFSYQGEFGIMLADSYNNAGFSIISAVVADNGSYDVTATGSQYPNNIIDVFTTVLTSPDPLGFGINGSNFASPIFKASYGSAESAIIPTKIALPLKRNNYYVNGIEKEKLTLESEQILDPYGDGYWISTITSINVFPGPSPIGRVQVTYRVPFDLSSTSLKVGKTLVVQSIGSGSIIDCGRFIIENINFNINCPSIDVYTDITVYDAVHGNGTSPATTLAVGNTVGIYFNSDSVSFNDETATDFTNASSTFKRHFEVLIDSNGNTFTHERGRINISSGTITINGSVPLYTFSELNKLNIVRISPKLRGYQFGSVSKITLNMTSYDTTTGEYSGYLASYDGSTFTHKGTVISGKKGEITRFYDETNIDYIDIVFDINSGISSFTNKTLDFQLFPTLSLDEEVMLLGTCQLNDITKTVDYLKDERQFGNTSEKDLTTSVLNLMSLPEKLLHSNGVIRGFDLQNTAVPNPSNGEIYLSGGVALVNGKILSINNETVNIPIIKETFGILYNVNWAICLNDKGEYQPIPLLDYDSVLGTINDSTRLFQAFNAVNGSTYYLDASTFSNILNNRKDLVLLYIAAATITLGSGSTPPSISLSISNARRYVNDVDGNLPLRLTSAESQGNFKDFTAIVTWLKYNNAFNSLAIVKGADATTGVINTELTLDFPSIAVIDGENSATLTVNQPITLGNNLIFRNLTINFNEEISIIDSVQNLTFENCTIHIDVPTTPPAENIIFNIVSGNNIFFRNCLITATFNSLFDQTSVFRGSVFKLTETTNFTFEDSTLVVSYQVDPGIVTPGNIFTLDSCLYITIESSIFSGNFNKFIDNDGSSSWKVLDCIISSTYNPNTGTSPDSYNSVAYSTSNLVNSGQGYIYSLVDGSLEDIVIERNTFNYNPITNTSDRYSFINFEFTTNTAILSDLSIRDCNFNNNNVSGTNDDFRSAIAIINKNSVIASQNPQPILLNANISNNKCNKNQSIILTSVTSASGIMFYPALVAIGCQIENNICGCIGYWTGAEIKVANISPTVTSLSERMAGLTIKNNNCHYICTVDHAGAFFLVSKYKSTFSSNVTQTTYSSGKVNIIGNTCNWIHTGIAFASANVLRITDNTLTAYNEAFLLNYGHDLPNAVYNPASPSVAVSPKYAIFVCGNEQQSNAFSPLGRDNPVIISGNCTEQGFWRDSSFTISIVYNYSLGYVYCQPSSIITNNIFRGVAETTNSGSLILVSGPFNIVTENKIYRETNSIFAYVAFLDFDIPTIHDGSESGGIISNNFFDSPYTNSTTLNEAVVNLNSVATKALKWTVEKNKNQTVSISIPMTNAQMSLYGNSGGTFGYVSGTSSTFRLTSAPDQSITGYKSQVFQLQDEDAPTNRYFGWQENLDKYIPAGARLVKLKMGVNPFDTNWDTTASFSRIIMYLNRYADAEDYLDLDYFTTFGITQDTNIINEVNDPFSMLTGATINAAGATVYLDIDVTNVITPAVGDVSENYVSRMGYSFSVSLDIKYRNVGNTHMYFSPLLVKYRW